MVPLFIVVCAAAAVVAGATDRGTRSRVPVRAVLPAPSAPVAPAHRRSGPSVEGPSVDKLIRATPIVTSGVGRARAIALTFDDGPSPYSPRIVAELRRLHVPATFFVVGQQLRYFAAGLRDEVRHGFEIGDHTQNHPWLIRLGARQQYLQVAAVAAAVRRLGAPAPTLFRPPYGAYDPATLSVLRSLRMLGVLWSIDPGDWRRPGSRAIVRSVLSAARPGGIVELHDGGGDRSETLAALPGLIGGLRRRGYRLVTVSELLRLDPPSRHQRLPRLSAA